MEEKNEKKKLYKRLKIRDNVKILENLEAGKTDEILMDMFKISKSTMLRIKSQKNKKKGIRVIQEKALQLNQNLGGSKEFKASNGWLYCFQKRHGIRQVKAQGEKQSPDSVPAEKFCEDFPEMSKGYEDENIYNGDETGILWWLVSLRSHDALKTVQYYYLAVKHKKVRGWTGKFSKSRLKKNSYPYN